MTAMPAAQAMTAQEFMELDRQGRSGTWNLVDGELVVNSPAFPHQRFAARLIFELANWAGSGPDRGEVVGHLDILIDDHNVYEPDVTWFRSGRVPVDLRPPYDVPDVAVEVRSPSTWRYDIGVKKTRYEQHGLPELWLVDGDAGVVRILRRSAPDAPEFDVDLELCGHDDVLESPLLPGFALPLARLFR